MVISPYCMLVSMLASFVMPKAHRAAKLQKVTVQLEADLLQRAQHACGDGVTGTIRRGLELLAAKDAYDAVRKRRGKVRLGLDLAALREDRRCSPSTPARSAHSWLAKKAPTSMQSPPWLRIA